MIHAVSTVSAIILLVFGVVVGAGGVYFTSHSGTVTITYTQTQTAAPTSSSGAQGLTLAQLEAGLNDSGKATLSIASYEFGKGSLDMWVLNNGTTPVVLAPQMVIYNGTWVSNTYFTILDNRIVQLGLYAYVPSGSQIIIQLSPNPPPITPSNAIVQILGNTFTFAYGTSKG